MRRIRAQRFAPLLLILASLCPFAAAAQGLNRIGVTVTDLGNPFFVRIARGIEASARKIAGPGVRVDVVSSAYDFNRQIGQIDSFIKKKVDLIMLIATDPIAIEPAVRRAQAAGIYVIALDVRAAGADATFTTDNVQAGEVACQFIADRLHGHGNVVILSGPPVSSITDRVSGCMAKFGATPDIHVLSSDRNGGGSSEGAFSKMTDILTQFPQIDAVFTINDPTALGVEEAAHHAGRKEFFVVSIDGAPKVKTRMREADSLIVATVAQMPDVLAQKAVESGYALIQHRPLPDPVVLIPGVLLTPDMPLDTNDWTR